MTTLDAIGERHRDFMERKHKALMNGIRALETRDARERRETSMSNLEITSDTLEKAALDIGMMLRLRASDIRTVWEDLLSDDVTRLTVKAAITFEVAKNGGLRVRTSMTIPGVAIKEESEFYPDDKQGKLFEGGGITSVTFEGCGKKVVLGDDPDGDA